MFYNNYILGDRCEVGEAIDDSKASRGSYDVINMTILNIIPQNYEFHLFYDYTI